MAVVPRTGEWLYVVTNCGSEPTLQDPIQDPIRYDWHEVRKVQHYYLNVDAMTQPMQVSEDTPSYGGMTYDKGTDPSGRE